MAEVDAVAAEEVLQGLEALGHPLETKSGSRGDMWIQPAGARAYAPASVLMWADVLGSARMESRVIARNLGLMFVAGIIAGYGVVIDNPILIVGAMAVSPDLVPLIAASVGIVAGRWSLVRRGATTLILGLGLATLAAFGVISVTTIPAAAMAGVAAGLADWPQALGGLVLLGVNLLCLIVAGCATLLAQRFIGRARHS